MPSKCRQPIRIDSNRPVLEYVRIDRQSIRRAVHQRWHHRRTPTEQSMAEQRSHKPTPTEIELKLISNRFFFVQSFFFTSVEMVGYGISSVSNSHPLLQGIISHFGSGLFTPLASCAVKLTAYMEHLLGTPFSNGMPIKILKKWRKEKKTTKN